MGEVKAVVDKRGGFQAGVNMILQIPLGENAFIQFQSFYQRAMYRNEMDNLANIYLGINHSAARQTTLTGIGGDAKLGIKIQ